MIVLGIESSCDETAAAVVDASGVRSDVVYSQVELHRRWGGVVPEVASRAHLEKIGAVVAEALLNAELTLAQVEGIAVTCAPGLQGALLVGVSYAKALAYALGIPLLGVHHLEGHLEAPFLGGEEPVHPFIALVVSGGHTGLYRVDAFGRYLCLGETRDDAAGEAFDKGAKLLGLSYPGGVIIDQLSVGGDPSAHVFPKGLWKRGNREFSFSGLKTALLTHLERHGVPEGQALSDVCASYQEAIVQVLVGKTLQVAREEGVPRVVLSGGVAANSRLRAHMAQEGRKMGISVHLPEKKHCTDNGAMIARAGRLRFLQGQRDGWDLSVQATLPLGSGEP